MPYRYAGYLTASKNPRWADTLRRRFRKEWLQMIRKGGSFGDLVKATSYAMCDAPTMEEREISRLAFADLAEEDGRPAIAKMIRDGIKCVKPKSQKKPKRRSKCR